MIMDDIVLEITTNYFWWFMISSLGTPSLSASDERLNLASKDGSQDLTIALRSAEYCLFLSALGISDGDAIAPISFFCCSLSWVILLTFPSPASPPSPFVELVRGVACN